MKTVLFSCSWECWGWIEPRVVTWRRDDGFIWLDLEILILIYFVPFVHCMWPSATHNACSNRLFHSVSVSFFFVFFSPVFFLDISFFIHFSIYFIAFDGICSDRWLSSKNIESWNEQHSNTHTHKMLKERNALLIWIIPFSLWKCALASILTIWSTKNQILCYLFPLCVIVRVHHWNTWYKKYANFACSKVICT